MYYVVKNEIVAEWSDHANLLSDKDNVQELCGVPCCEYNQNPQRFKLSDGAIVDLIDSQEYVSSQLEEKKALKLRENDEKRKIEFISTSYGKLKTSTPIGDLSTVINSLAISVQLTGALAAGMIRFYFEDGSAVENNQMNAQEFAEFFNQIMTAYKIIDNKSVQFAAAINSARTIHELESINISYE